MKVAGGQGFYGDTPTAVDALLADGVDYLCLEALAELTLAILQKDRQRDETRGYTRDLPAYLTRALPFVGDGRTKVITNAGGINPTAAARVAIDTARDAGFSGLRVATVLGDDLTTRLPELSDALPLAHMDTGAPWSELPDAPLLATAYLGARPIVDALAQGADIVITGRVADASLFLAACVHAHDWAWDDWDRLAAGILVGHLLECSGQSLGGNYSGDWWALPHPWDLPYPIAQVEADGSAVISKPAGSGGRVSTDTLRHQLLYEVHDPAAYVSPDVVADFTSARFEDLADDRVRVTGVKRRSSDADLQDARHAPRRMGRRGARRVLVARRAGEGEGDGRDLCPAGGDGRPRGRRMARRALGRRRARRPDGAGHDRRTARVRAARRVAVRRRAHGRLRRS